jgi:hypothetical protein
MKIHYKSTYTARLNIFLAGCKEVPEIESRLKSILLLYVQTPLIPSKENSEPWQPKNHWELLLSHCNQEETRREKWIKVMQFDPWCYRPLKAALEEWACFTHEGKTINLRNLGDWVYYIALYQLWDWQYHPEQKELCYSWRNFQEHSVFQLKDEPQPKFIYTLGVPLESHWEDAFSEADSVTHGGVGIWSVFGTSYNPYAVVNSELLYKEDQTKDDEESSTLPDWNPESGESKRDFKKRIIKHFEKQLDKHLERVVQWYYETPSDEEQETKKPPSGKTHTKNGDRDYLWTFQRYVLGMSSTKVAEIWNEEKIGYKNVNTQVSGITELAQLPALTEKNK